MKAGINETETQHMKTFSFTVEFARQYLLMIQSPNKTLMAEFIYAIEGFNKQYALARPPYQHGHVLHSHWLGRPHYKREVALLNHGLIERNLRADGLGG